MSRHVNADARRRLALKELEEANRTKADELRLMENGQFTEAWKELVEIARVRQMIEKGVDE